MNEEILKLNPTGIWKHFKTLCDIPRPSKKEERIAKYVKEFGEGLGLETIVDSTGNIIIRKPATAGLGHKKGIILQAHLDMVPQANSDTTHNFETDPIETIIEGEWVTANGTTLGADNGMGVAAAMAVLESDNIPHGPIEALFTIDEETGMTGAFGLEPNILKGDILINMDSEDEGELYVGCAGGMDASISLSYAEESPADTEKAYIISVKGLKGGHSGMDISLGRANSNKLLVRLLRHCTKLNDISVSSIKGGSLRNAIPRESFATITIPAENTKAFLLEAEKLTGAYKQEYAETEPDLQVKIEETTLPAKVMGKASKEALLNSVYGCPNGVIRMSQSMQGLVETSVNLAVVNAKEGKAEILCLLRSSVDTAKLDLGNMIESIFELAGAEVMFAGSYPGWKPNPNSAILEKMKDVYNQKFGIVPEIKAIHAGLECGILGGVYPNLDMISFGPTIRFPHSPDEKVNIETVQKFWDFLIETLKQAPEKE